MSTVNGNGNLRERLREHARTAHSEPYTIDEWDETVELRSMSVGEKYALFGDDAETDDQGDVKLKPSQLGQMVSDVVIATVFDPDTGEPMFSAEDKTELDGWPAPVIEPLAQAGLKASGIGEDAVEEAGKGSS